MNEAHQKDSDETETHPLAIFLDRVEKLPDVITRPVVPTNCCKFADQKQRAESGRFFLSMTHFLGVGYR